MIASRIFDDKFKSIKLYFARILTSARTFLAVIEVASGEYGDKVIPKLIKAWKVQLEESRRKKSLTYNDMQVNNGKDSMVQVMPDCTTKTSTDSLGLIEAVSQTTQVNGKAAMRKRIT